MFDFDAGKIIIVGVIALIFIPPKDLPRVMRQVGQFVGKMRRMAADFQGQFMDAMREADMADLKHEAQKLSDAARVSTGLDSLHDLNTHMTSALDRPVPPSETSTAPVSDPVVPPPAELPSEVAAPAPVAPAPAAISHDDEKTAATMGHVA